MSTTLNYETQCCSPLEPLRSGFLVIVSDDIAALQFPEEPFWIHSSGFAIGFKSMSKEKTAEWRGGHEPFRQTRQL